MASLPIEILFGVYLGILTGIIPGLVALTLGFVVKYFTGVTLPGFGVVVLGVAMAGVNGGLLALIDPSITESANAPMVITALLVVVMITLYAHNKGDAMGATVPKRLSLRGLRDRTLSTDVVQLVGGRAEVSVRVAGDVTDIEGYPPLSPDLRSAIRWGEWSFPADIPLPELESRLADRLRTEYDLAEVSVSVDERGRATIAAAPPLGGLSRRVTGGKRAVSVEALVPTGIARGDEVTLLTPGGDVRGTVVSARSGPRTVDEHHRAESPAANDTGAPGDPADGEEQTPPNAAPTTTGGRGRLTVAVPRSDAETLLRAESAAVVVESRGVRREYELISLLRRAGRRFRKLSIRAGGELDGATLGEAGVRDRFGVGVLAVRRPTGWVLAPRGETELAAGDELFAAGPREALERFAEAVA